MNKIYFFHDEEGRGVYVGAKTWKEGRLYALLDELFDSMDNKFIDIRGYTVSKVLTEIEGIISIKQLAELNLLWFECYNCDSSNIEIINDFKYKCRECNLEFNIPY